MTNDKALESVARVIARDLGGENYDEHDWGVFASTAEKAISAYSSALPGEAEVVAWHGDDAGGGRKFTAMSRVSEIWADQCLIVTPLVTLASFQAMQARALAAEALVEKAFRDGLAYGSNTENADADVAWEHSRARAALTGGSNG